MEIYKFDAIIIGAGIIGLAVANELCGRYNSILVIEKENTFGQHISSRNSEVIHSGIYYSPDSMKAQLCVKGNQLMYDFAKKYNINYKNCGKIIVATVPIEMEQLEILMKNGQKNNVKGLELISASEVSKREPIIKSAGGLSVPSAGIIDSHALMHKLAYKITSNNSNIVYNTEVDNIINENDGYRITFKNIDYAAKSHIVINSAGLWCDKISKMVGVGDYRLHFCKGEYYKTSMYRNKLNALIYPLPTKISLGTHIVLHLDGSIGFGPNAYYIDEIDYSIDDSNKKKFLKNINKYMDLTEEELNEDFSGIRPKIQAQDKPQEDFIIKNETEKGYHNFINLIGIESPGLTASLAIAEYVKNIID